MEPPLGRRLYLGHRAVHDALDERMGERGASLWHWILLRQAAEHEGSSQRELAERMHIEPPTLVRHLDKLAARRPGRAPARRAGPPHRPRVPHRRRAAPARRSSHGVAEEVDAELRALLTEREIDVLGDDPDAHPRALHRARRRNAVPTSVDQQPADVASGTGRGDPHRGADEGLPGRHPRGRRARPLGAARRDLRPARPERRGQDDDRGDAHDPRDPDRAGARSSAASTSSRHPTAAKQVIGVVPQTNTLDRSLTVWENLYFHGRFFGMNAKTSKAEADAAARAVPARRPGRRRRCSRSPGGMAQRLMVARAIMHRPAILFLDEPTAGLDPQSRIALWDILGELHRDGQTILLTTHYMEEADELCDRLAIIDRGKLLALDTPAALKQSVGIDAMVTVTADGDLDRLADVLRDEIPNATKVEHVDGVVRVGVRQIQGVLPTVVDAAERHGFTVSDLSSTEPTLETVFINLTGKDLRE